MTSSSNSRPAVGTKRSSRCTYVLMPCNTVPGPLTHSLSSHSHTLYFYSQQVYHVRYTLTHSHTHSLSLTELFTHCITASLTYSLMGKAGKARKKQKLLTQALATPTHSLTPLSHSTNSDSDSDSDTEHVNECESDLTTAITLLTTLSTRLTHYHTRSLKPLRIALYPLIQQQLHKFFEDPPPPEELSEEEVNQRLEYTNIATTISLAHSLTQDLEKFASLEYKEFRRALHPFVQLQLQQQRKTTAESKSTHSSKVLPAGWNTHSTTHSTTATSATSIQLGEKKQSLSNRVAYHYRVGDWLGALRALHELRLSSDMPKLGEILYVVSCCVVPYVHISLRACVRYVITPYDTFMVCRFSAALGSRIRRGDIPTVKYEIRGFFPCCAHSRA